MSADSISVPSPEPLPDPTPVGGPDDETKAANGTAATNKNTTAMHLFAPDPNSGENVS